MTFALVPHTPRPILVWSSSAPPWLSSCSLPPGSCPLNISPGFCPRRTALPEASVPLLLLLLSSFSPSSSSFKFSLFSPFFSSSSPFHFDFLSYSLLPCSWPPTSLQELAPCPPPTAGPPPPPASGPLPPPADSPPPPPAASPPPPSAAGSLPPVPWRRPSSRVQLPCSGSGLPTPDKSDITWASLRKWRRARPLRLLYRWPVSGNTFHPPLRSLSPAVDDYSRNDT